MLRVICNGPKTERYMELIEELRGKGLIVIPIIEDPVELERMQKWLQRDEKGRLAAAG